MITVKIVISSFITALSSKYICFRYPEAFRDHNSLYFAPLGIHCTERFPHSIDCVPTDNGSEFTNGTNSMTTIRPMRFKRALGELCFQYTRIRALSPRHNGQS